MPTYWHRASGSNRISIPRCAKTGPDLTPVAPAFSQVRRFFLQHWVLGALSWFVHPAGFWTSRGLPCNRRVHEGRGFDPLAPTLARWAVAEVKVVWASPLRPCGVSVELARNQVNDRDDPSSLPRPLTVVGVLREGAVSKIPQPLPLGFVLHDFGTEWQAAEDDVGMLAQVVVPGWVLRRSPLRRDDYHSLAIAEVERGIPTPLTCPRASRLEQRRGKRPPGAQPTLRRRPAARDRDSARSPIRRRAPVASP